MYDLNDAQPQMAPMGELIPDGTFAKVKDVGANVEDWTDTGPFKAATQYGYRVRAKNAAGYSAYSNIASETP